MKNKLSVVEIFNSIQGEGANVGKAATFIRLSGCNLNCSYCDTEWETGVEMSIDEIKREVEKYSTRLIIWTGGEPTLQLNSEILQQFTAYTQAIETNGTTPVPAGIDYVSCSPKVSAATLRGNFTYVDEFRFPVSVGSIVPSIDELPDAANYFLSPVFTGDEKKMESLDIQNLEYCLKIIENDPRWRLSVQLHKLLRVR